MSKGIRLSSIVLTAAIALLVSGLFALGYSSAGPYHDTVWGTLYTHEPRLCDGGTFPDNTFVSQCYTFHVEDTPSQDLTTLTWINWGALQPVEYDGGDLFWGVTWIVDRQNGNNTHQYVDFLCNPFLNEQMTPDYYWRTSGGTYTSFSSVQQYVYGGSCPPGGLQPSMYEELEVYTQ